MKQPAVRTPAEWEPHARCLITWPHREDLWEERLKAVQEEYAAVARAIAQFEPVLMVANPGSGEDAKRQCGGNVEAVELPVDDSWLRDNGPIFVLEDRKKVVGRNFRFNAWGERFHPWDKDDALPDILCDHLNVECRPVDMILEGGSIYTDGEGTLITTKQCLLSPNRNPAMSQSEIEAALQESLGIRKIIWLPWGFHDSQTDGHVDGVAAYLAPAKVMLQSAPPGTPDESRFKENRKILEAATDARGRKFEIVDMPLLPDVDVGGDEGVMHHIYANFYLPNGGVVVPLAGAPEDDEAMALLRKNFPDRKVVGIPVPNVRSGGGAIHCITQQMPAAPA
jgi:agmatine deiminase